MQTNRISKALAEKLNTKRLMFTVTTGRSGTNYVANMLSYIPSISSTHEPNPSFHQVMPQVKQDKDEAYRFLTEVKLPFIANLSQTIYIETSHVFCKGFFEPLIELGIIPELLLLRRNNRQVATSMYRLGHIPGRSKIGEIFLINPGDSVFISLPGWQAMHDYQLCYWYCLEIEARRQRYGREILRRGGQVYEVTLADFSTIFGYYRFLHQANLPLPPPINMLRHLKSHLSRVNSKEDLKNFDSHENWQAMEAQVEQNIQIHEQTKGGIKK